MMDPAKRAKAILDRQIDEIAARAKKYARSDFDQHVLPLVAGGSEAADRYALLKYTLNPIIGKAVDAAMREYVLAMMDDRSGSFEEES